MPSINILLSIPRLRLAPRPRAASVTVCKVATLPPKVIRPLKENLLWVRSFETIEELRLALLAFKRTHNEQWTLEKYTYRSPAHLRRDLVGLDAAA